MKAVHCPWTRNPLSSGACPRYRDHGDCAACPYNEDVQKKTVPEAEDPPAKKPRRKAPTPER